MGGAGGGDSELPALPLHSEGGPGNVRLPPPPPRHLPHRNHHGESKGSKQTLIQAPGRKISLVI